MVTNIDLDTVHNPEKLDFVFQLFTSMQKDNLNYIYRGMFSQRIMESILGMAERNIVNSDEKSVIKKRVYHIMVECLQNITRHQAPVLEDDSEDASLFILQKKYKKYYITTGNIIEPELIPDLKSKIEKINSLSQHELKDYYRRMLVNGMLSEKGGAGLGLIDMARKSGNKLTYHFKEINEEKAFFFLTTEVFTHDTAESSEQNLSIVPAEGTDIHDIEQIVPTVQRADGLFSIESVSELHDLLNQNNIKIIFNNYFNTESLETLLIFLDKQICETLNIDRKVYTVMVELFLNIIIHGSNPVENKRHKGNPGLFFIREVDGLFVVNTSNYITNDRIEDLLQKIDYVNNMTTEETDAMEESIDVQKIVSEKGGLGLASIKQITKHNIDIHLCKVDDEYTFLTISCAIAKLAKDPLADLFNNKTDNSESDQEIATIADESELEGIITDEEDTNEAETNLASEIEQTVEEGEIELTEETETIEVEGIEKTESVADESEIATEISTQEGTTTESTEVNKVEDAGEVESEAIATEPETAQEEVKPEITTPETTDEEPQEPSIEPEHE